MKRIVGALLCAVLLLGCAGCGVETYDGKIHLPQWGGDLEKHWYIDESGAVSQKGKHTLDGEICTVCNATVSHYVGGATLSVPDAFGDVAVYIEYDESGKVIWDTYNYYEHDENGWLTYQINYDGDRLQEETIYQMHRIEQEPCALVSTFYDVSGIVEEITYNDIGEIIQIVKKDADGQVTRTERYERVYGEDNNLRNEKIYVDDVLATERIYVDDGFGFYYIGEEITYRPDGAVDIVTKYDIEGNIVE